MSFSSKIKNEAAVEIPKARHCRIAELAAIYSGLKPQGRVRISKKIIIFKTENLTVANKSYILLRKVFHTAPEVMVRHHRGAKGSNVYMIALSGEDIVESFTKTMKLKPDYDISCGKLIQSECCKRAFLRGAFLVSGSMIDPNKSYHLEIVSQNSGYTEALKRIMGAFDFDVRITTRKKAEVLYIKEGTQISDFLNYIQAYKCMLDFENVRIVKGVRNNINRGVNCETANISRIVSAAQKQREDILLIKQKMGLQNLSPGLRQIAELRLNYPEASLQELADLLGPNISKSGVNHRLRRLSEIAKNYK
ncbi:MAG: DNA-binding protein WhiA [Lachnospiraceae bacterium]|nr:DNA-binding protein WhiA [Lachnospiraceae bacterium]